MRRVDGVIFSGVILVFVYLIISALPIILNNHQSSVQSQKMLGIFIASASYNSSSPIYGDHINQVLLGMIVIGTLLIVAFCIWAIHRVYKRVEPNLTIYMLIVLGIILTAGGVELNFFSASSYASGGAILPYVASPFSLVLIITGLVIIFSCVGALWKIGSNAKKLENMDRKIDEKPLSRENEKPV